MKCESCGNIIKDNEKYCRKCGMSKQKQYVNINNQNIEVIESVDINTVDPIEIINEDVVEQENPNEEIENEIEKADKKSRNFLIAGIITLLVILVFVIVLIIAISYSLK